MLVDVDHFPYRGPVRERASGAPLKLSVCVLVCLDYALLVAWALVISGFVGLWAGAQFVCRAGAQLCVMRSRPSSYEIVQAP